MSKLIVSVSSSKYMRANWVISVKGGGLRSDTIEVSGDEGEAAATALRYAMLSDDAIIVACAKVMALIPEEYGGAR